MQKSFHARLREEVTSVKPFSETDVDQPSINANEFYCRYRYDHVKRQVIVRSSIDMCNTSSALILILGRTRGYEHLYLQ